MDPDDNLPEKVAAVRDALTDYGPAPTLHRAELDRLECRWPTLYNALVNLLGRQP